MFVFNQNFGAQHKSYWEDDNASTIGVTRVLGVPIWDNGQGIGSRMPNLVSQPTQSPVIFFGTQLPIENIAIPSNFLILITALSVLNLTVLSWSERQIYRRLLFMDIAILGPYFLFTAVINWFIISDQYWGLTLVISSFLHPVWYRASMEDGESWRPSIVLFALTIGSSILLTGHVLFLQIALIVLMVFVISNFSKLKKILGLFPVFMLVTLGVAMAVPQLLELGSQTWDASIAVHSSQPSVFDIFVPEELRVYRFQPLMAFVVAGTQPVLRLINDAGPRTDFFNLMLLIYIMKFFLSSRKQISPLSRMLKLSVMTIAFIFINLTFAGLLARSKYPVISKLFDFHVWELSTLLLPIVILVTTILFGTEKRVVVSSNFFVGCNRSFLATGLVLAIMYPLVMVVKDAPRWNPEHELHRLIKDDSKIMPISLGLEMKHRSILLNEAVIQSFTGIDKNVVRSGYPLINSQIYGRSSTTLRKTEQRFRSVFDPSVLDCQPVVLDLLAVETIVFEGDGEITCSENLRNYYRSSDEISINKVLGTKTVLSAKPRQFSSWSIATSPISNPIEPCPLFEKNCLVGLTVTRLELDSGAPFKLCDQKCVFTYKWSAPLNAKQVLVPENYDQTIEVIDQKSGAKLRTASYQGLLAVEIPSGANNGVFEATIKPDAMMWIRVSATYIHTFVLFASLLLIAVRGFRSRKNRREIPMLSESES